MPLASCGPAAPPGDGAPGTVQRRVTAPLQAYCSITVTGTGTIDLEGDYLPHVVQCENGGANLQALEVQAIAARSVAYYNIATSGSICDGQAYQVYSCGATPNATQIQAVDETRGMVLTYAGLLTYGFFVAGDTNTAPPACHGSSGSTEHFVTYNEGKSGTSVTQTSLGYVGPPGYGQNRGCTAKWGARCLESDADPETDGSAYYRVCTWQAVKSWFEVENAGTASWTDSGGAENGQAVRLGVPGDTNDPFVGKSRMSVAANANNDVHPDGGDCNDQPACRRTIFSTDPASPAVAPSTPGVYKTDWKVVDEGRAWFGPGMYLTFNVVDCASDGAAGATAGGASGSAGADNDAGWSSAAGSGGGGGSIATNTGGAAGNDSGAGQQDRVVGHDSSGCACRTASAPDRQTRMPLLLALLALARARTRGARRSGALPRHRVRGSGAWSGDVDPTPDALAGELQ